MGLPPWALPLLAGVGIGWFFSGSIARIINPIAANFNLRGGNEALAYQAGSHPHQPYPSVAPRERRSFDRAYDSYLLNTVNALPTIG